MLHFFPHYAEDVTNTPFAAELRRLQVPHRFFSAEIRLRYKTMFGLLFSVYPRLTWLALRSAIRSLALSHPRPTAVIVCTDVEALVFGILRRILRLSTLIVFETLIITHTNLVFRRYYRLILSLIDIGICHSRNEVGRYIRAFPGVHCRFVFVPFGTTVNCREKLIAAYATAVDKDGAIVSAGRSSRDYRTLAEAIRGLPCKLRIICDIAGPVAQISPSEQITIVRDCFGMTYIEALANALFVVVPLTVDDISAGQMVLLQAAALGKAVIISRTATTVEYATGEQDALFVDMGNVEQMRAAICRLLEDHALRGRLGVAAARRFENEYSTESYVRNIVSVIQSTILSPNTL